MDVANASMYDGSTGAAEAVMMAVRITGRHKAVVATSVHPEYREVLATYTKHQSIPTSTVPFDLKTGRIISTNSPPPSPPKPPPSSSRAPTSSASLKTSQPSPTSPTPRARC